MFLLRCFTEQEFIHVGVINREWYRYDFQLLNLQLSDAAPTSFCVSYNGLRWTEYVLVSDLIIRTTLSVLLKYLHLICAFVCIHSVRHMLLNFVCFRCRLADYILAKLTFFSSVFLRHSVFSLVMTTNSRVIESTYLKINYSHS